jgi:four helix bundle protein
VKYSEWMKTVPETIKSDSLWRMAAYRYALWLSELAWFDVTKLLKDRRTLELSGQLYAAVGSIGANLSEGYSRGTGRDRARFYEYSLGSGREGRHWYYDGRHMLGQDVADHRLALLSEIIRLTLTMVPQQRGDILHEEGSPYRADNETLDASISPNLLENVPMPAP